MPTVYAWLAPSVSQLTLQLAYPKAPRHQQVSLANRDSQARCCHLHGTWLSKGASPRLFLKRTAGASIAQSERVAGKARAGSEQAGVGAAAVPLDLTEENITIVLTEARTELLQLFDTTVGITGIAELADLDGPYVTIRLKGRFWHERSLVLARLRSYLMKRIPEIVDVNIESEAQLDDSPANF